ncbi:hypothetical protein [Consotaella aegiceratis]|uniref:hypothetical protein n=1 Tax=Consotaella aegiceratis TaxID=3097961 RepID=UPI002F40E53E
MSNSVPISVDTLDHFVRPYLKEVATIHSEILRRLLDEPSVIPLDLAEAFEDAGNKFIDLSHMISRRYLAATQDEAD